MDIFENKNIKPMLIGEIGQQPFDSPDYIYELKLDGERCIAYLDVNEIDLRSKGNLKLFHKMPELSQIHKQVSKRCILDGELIVLKDGVPDFSEIQRRNILSDRFKIDLSSKKYPITFTAFDILYCEGEQVTYLPLMKRKELLSQILCENDRISLSRYIEKDGNTFYQIVEEKGLEGIVAKRRDSIYKPGVRTKDWTKIKCLKDEDFYICGYIEGKKGERYVANIILGEYENGILKYQGSIILNMLRYEFNLILQQEIIECPFSYAEKDAIYIKPNLICSVKYLERTKDNKIRHAVFKNIRSD